MLKPDAGSSAEHLSHEVLVSFPARVDQTLTGAQRLTAPLVARNVPARPGSGSRLARHGAARQAVAPGRCRRRAVAAHALPGALPSSHAAR